MTYMRPKRYYNLIYDEKNDDLKKMVISLTLLNFTQGNHNQIYREISVW